MKRFVLIHWMVVLSVLALVVLPSQTQGTSDTFISLEMETTNLSTGTYYDVDIVVTNVEELWLANVIFEYDASKIYIVGTQAGSPVRGGEFLPDLRFVARNQIQGNRLIYTPSILAPADPVSGTGVIGTFRIYPLESGEVVFRFVEANLTRLTFTQDEEGQRIVDETLPITALPVLLTVNITGNSVARPSEATATPTPTQEIIFFDDDVIMATAEPTLFNVTAIPPTSEPHPMMIPDIDEAPSETPSTIFIGIFLILGAIIGFIALFWMRRSR